MLPSIWIRSWRDLVRGYRHHKTRCFPMIAMIEQEKRRVRRGKMYLTIRGVIK